MKKTNVFLDSSVLLAGLVSTTGASAEILRLAEIGVVELMVCDLVIDEVKRNLTKKLPEFLPYFYTALEVLKPRITQNQETVDTVLTRLIPKKSDQIIIQTALISKPVYFITLDKKHLLKPVVRTAVAMPVITPSEFLGIIRFKN